MSERVWRDRYLFTLLVGKSIDTATMERNTCVCVRAKLLQLCLTLCDQWTAPCQAPLSMGFSKQEYWSG